MKIRKGFVSNSSSSSFVIVGNEVKFKDITPSDKIKMLVEGIAEHTVAMNVSKSDYKYLQKHPEVIGEMDIKFFKTIASGCEEIELNKADMPEKVKIYTLEVDQYEPDSLESAIEENGESN
jgi:hypothetical protein